MAQHVDSEALLINSRNDEVDQVTGVETGEATTQSIGRDAGTMELGAKSRSTGENTATGITKHNQNLVDDGEKPSIDVVI